MKKAFTQLQSLSLIFIISACNIAGPGYPKKGAEKYLKQKDYPEKMVKAIVQKKSLSHKDIVLLSKCPDINVLYMVGSNPYLTPSEIDLFIDNKNDFVRSGVARNPNLTKKQMLKLLNDSSHTVYCTLAGNPEVPENLLLELRKSRDLKLSWFALNPNCPQELKKEIIKSNDHDAQYWMNVVEKRIQTDKYTMDASGRWHKVYN
jgi:hypothetical protein